MKVLVTILMLLSFNAFAGLKTKSIFLQSADDVAAMELVNRVMELESASTIMDARIFRIQEMKSFIKFRVKDRAAQKALIKEIRDENIKLVTGLDALMIATIETLRSPRFINYNTLGEKDLITYGYFKMEAPSLNDNRLNVYNLSLIPARNVSQMESIARSAPEDSSEATFTQILSKHTAILTALREINASTVRGAICDSLFCSCFGLSSCLSVNAACSKLHASLEDTSKFTCHKSYRNICVAGSCRMH